MIKEIRVNDLNASRLTSKNFLVQWFNNDGSPVFMCVSPRIEISLILFLWLWEIVDIFLSDHLRESHTNDNTLRNKDILMAR